MFLCEKSLLEIKGKRLIEIKTEKLNKHLENAAVHEQNNSQIYWGGGGGGEGLRCVAINRRQKK